LLRFFPDQEKPRLDFDDMGIISQDGIQKLLKRGVDQMDATRIKQSARKRPVCGEIHGCQWKITHCGGARRPAPG
jgi:hypothetical protein